MLLSRHQVKEMVLETVSYYRSKAPHMGALKLYAEIRSIYGRSVTGGRDAFLNLLRSQKLMLPAKITYVWIQGGVCYLHLLTDVYSHAVLGWTLASGLHAVHTIQSLKQAIVKAGGGNLCGTVHHLDRGTQYACDAYVQELPEHHIRISMTERSEHTDNAVAERINGILKTE